MNTCLSNPLNPKRPVVGSRPAVNVRQDPKTVARHLYQNYRRREQREFLFWRRKIWEDPYSTDDWLEQPVKEGNYFDFPQKEKAPTAQKEDTKWERKEDKPYRDPLFETWNIPNPTKPPRIPDDLPEPPGGLDELVEQTEPVHPIEQSDEAEDEGESKEQTEPRTAKPRYTVYPKCSDDIIEQILYNVPPCRETHGALSIQTTKLRPKSKNGKAHNKGRFRNNPF